MIQSGKFLSEGVMPFHLIKKKLANSLLKKL